MIVVCKYMLLRQSMDLVLSAELSVSEGYEMSQRIGRKPRLLVDGTLGCERAVRIEY